MTDKQPDIAPKVEKGPVDPYLAGYFDAEGHVGFHNRTDGSLPQVRITAKSANLPSLQALQVRFGGKLLLHSVPTARKKSLYRWRIGSLRDCHMFVMAIEPHSIEKPVQLSLARQWLDHRMEIPLRGRRSPETHGMAREIHEAITAQKHLDFFVSAMENQTSGDKKALAEQPCDDHASFPRRFM